MSFNSYEPFTNQDDIQNMSEVDSEIAENNPVIVNEEEDKVLRRSETLAGTPTQSQTEIRPRSKTISTGTSTSDDHQSLPSHAQTGFNLLQSIKDLTHQELFRANPLGLLGKEVIAATGTNNPPEPVAPSTEEPTSSSSPNKLSPIRENEPQELQFHLSDEQLQQQQSRRPTIADAATPQIPVLFELDADLLAVQGGALLLSPLNPATTKLDFIPDTMTINVFEVFIYAWGVFAFFFDMVTDIILAHAYYGEGSYWLFILTLACVVVPNLTLSLFSLVWYMDGPKGLSQTTPLVNDDSCETSSAESDDVKQKEGQQQQNKGNGADPDTLNRRRTVSHESNRRTSFSQTDDIKIRRNSLDEPDAHVNRARYSPQTPPSERKKVNTSDEIVAQPSSATSNALRWIIRIIILVLQLDLCLKYIRGLYYTYKGYRHRKNKEWQRYYLTKQILIDADIALLRVFDVFMDSGSQVILQLYIMLKDSKSLIYDALFLKQSLSIVSSLGALAYGLSGYSRCLRHMMLTHSTVDWPKDKPAPKPVTWWATIIHWVWYLFLITPRVLALAMFAASSRSWFWIIICAHWMGMLFWILRFRTGFCISDQSKYIPREAIFEKCYNIVCSYIYIFCYMNLTEGHTRQRYIAFYTVYYIENIAFSVIYAVHSQEKNLLFKYSLVTFVCTGFWFAVLFQFVYYQCFHPSDHVRANVKKDFTLMIRNRTLPIFDRNRTNIQKSKSYDDILEKDIKNQDKSSSFDQTTDKPLRKTTSEENINEATHNRFSKQNRQTLLSKQQTIEQQHRLNRSTSDQQQEEIHRSHPKQKDSSSFSSFSGNKTKQHHNSFLSKISNVLNRPSPIPLDYSKDNNVEYRTKQSSSRRPFFDIPSATMSLQEPLYLNMDEDNDDENPLNTNKNVSKRKAEGHHRSHQSTHLSSISDSVYANEQLMYKIHENNNDDESSKRYKNNRSNNEKHIVLNAKSLTAIVKTIDNDNSNNQENYIINNNITTVGSCDYPVNKFSTIDQNNEQLNLNNSDKSIELKYFLLTHCLPSLFLFSTSCSCSNSCICHQCSTIIDYCIIDETILIEEKEQNYYIDNCKKKLAHDVLNSDVVLLPVHSCHCSYPFTKDLYKSFSFNHSSTSCTYLLFCKTISYLTSNLLSSKQSFSTCSSKTLAPSENYSSKTLTPTSSPLALTLQISSSYPNANYFPHLIGVPLSSTYPFSTQPYQISASPSIVRSSSTLPSIGSLPSKLFINSNHTNAATDNFTTSASYPPPFSTIKNTHKISEICQSTKTSLKSSDNISTVNNYQNTYSNSKNSSHDQSSHNKLVNTYTKNSKLPISSSLSCLLVNPQNKQRSYQRLKSFLSSQNHHRKTKSLFRHSVANCYSSSSIHQMKLLPHRRSFSVNYRKRYSPLSSRLLLTTPRTHFILDRIFAFSNETIV